MAEKKEKKEIVSTNDNPFGVALTEKLESVADALPQDFNRARFVQNCLALLNDDPEKYQKFGSKQLMANLLKGAYLDLNFFSKEAYLVPYGDKLEFMPSYSGQIKLAKKYSIRQIKDVYAKVIREGDEFIEEIKNGEPSITFRPKFLNDGAIIGAFAVVVYTDGGMGYDVMSKADIENTRKSSKAKNSPAWTNFYSEMAKKTVLRRLCKHIALDFESTKQRAIFDEDMELETDPQKLNEIHVEAEANTVEFIDADAKEVTEDAPSDDRNGK